MVKEDYWGNLTAEMPLNLPVQLLEEQAAILEDKTDNLLTGTVASQTIGNQIRTTLAVIAPELEYRFDLVSIYFPVNGEDLYPIEIRNDLTNEKSMCKNEGEFKARLRERLSSPQTNSSLQKLLDASQRTYRT